MSRRISFERRPNVALLAAVVWIAGITMAQAMGDGGNGGGSGGDGGPGGRRVDPPQAFGPKGNVPACADGKVYDAKLNRCVKAERAPPAAARPAVG